MLNILTDIKLKQIKELSDNERTNVITEVVTYVAKFNGNKFSNSDLIDITEQIDYFLNTKFKYLKVHEIINACDNGLTDMYGKDYKFCAKTIIGWIGQFQRDSSSYKYREHVQENKTEYSEFTPTNESRLYGIACLIRITYDPGRRLCDIKGWTLDNIVSGIKEGKNIITGKSFNLNEIKEDAKSNVFAKNIS